MFPAISLVDLPRDIHFEIASYLKIDGLRALQRTNKALFAIYKDLFVIRRKYYIQKLRKFAKYNLVKSYCNYFTQWMYPLENRIPAKATVYDEIWRGSMNVIQNAILYLPRQSDHNIKIFTKYATYSTGEYGLRISRIMDIEQHGILLTVIFVELEHYMFLDIEYAHSHDFIVYRNGKSIGVIKKVLYGFNCEPQDIKIPDELVNPAKDYFTGKWNSKVTSRNPSLMFSDKGYSLKYISRCVYDTRECGNLKVHASWRLALKPYLRTYCSKCLPNFTWLQIYYSDFENYMDDSELGCELIDKQKYQITTVKVQEGFIHYFHACECVDFPHIPPKSRYLFNFYDGGINGI
jgi:hypothetical protein